MLCEREPGSRKGRPHDKSGTYYARPWLARGSRGHQCIIGRIEHLLTELGEALDGTFAID